MTEIFSEIGKIYKRLFDQKSFITSELNLVVEEFEDKRGDREVDNLIQSLEITEELKSSRVEKCCKLIDQNLGDLQKDLNLTLAACEELANRQPDPVIYQVLEKNRETRQKLSEDFSHDMRHKRQRIDLTFEEKEEELCEFYSDLERKLHINK